MLKHNLLLYLRNIKKHKSSFLINLVGLSTGLICVLLVYLWVFDELNKDKFHQNEERLYQVRRNVPMGFGAIGTFTSNSSLMLTALQEEIPEVEMATAVYNIDNKSTLQTEEKKLSGFGRMASEDFFRIFSFPLISGDKSTVLADANSVTISSELSANFFGEVTDPIGKSIAIKVSEENVDDVFTITGVYEVPKDSSEEFDFVLPYKTFLKYRDPDDIAWYSNSSSMYALLKPDIDIEALNTKMVDFLGTKSQYSKNEKVLFTKYSDNYLRGTYENGKQAGGRITYVMLFSIVALFVLSIACINFMNLSTARASRRLKEVGVKKAVGANRKSLIFQFLSESLLLSFFALVCAYIVVIIILPWFNSITGKELVFSIEPEILITLIVIALLTGLTSGSYPAFYLTKFNAVKVLKGKISTSFGELMIRKGLVVFQFSISILLIVAVSVIYMQLDYIQSKNLGYNKDNVMVIDRQDGLITNMDVFIEEAKQIPGVVNASFMQGGMTNFSNSSRGHSWPGQNEEGKEITFRHAHVGPEFIETMGIEMKLGRSYINEKPDNDSKIILNETAVKMMGLENPIGTIINMRGPNREIIGVVKDFNIQSLYDEIAPMALLCRTEWVSSLVLRIKAGEEKATISELSNLYNKFNPGLGFNFRFLDDQYQQLYQSEQRVATLSKYFAGMAILISCLGLFGLAAFTAERRRKEISIRKVLGQSISQVTVMLSSEFVKLVLIAIFITLPISYLLAADWLSDFAYKISLHSGYFIGAALAALITAILTVGSQAIRAANENPIKALKEE
ncbi:ABC transporter permease [Spongiivirga sp. MCCC 1A20706]|uniref:ABC transporter permease n=1 Tax=Spongiivirga sp. MCCC 1A20706 TaxID=3160963 RepID=UPI00397786B6